MVAAASVAAVVVASSTWSFGGRGNFSSNGCGSFSSNGNGNGSFSSSGDFLEELRTSKFQLLASNFELPVPTKQWPNPRETILHLFCSRFSEKQRRKQSLMPKSPMTANWATCPIPSSFFNFSDFLFYLAKKTIMPM